MHFYPKVEEGSMITVPQKPEKQDAGDVIKTVLLSTVPIILTGVILKSIN